MTNSSSHESRLTFTCSLFLVWNISVTNTWHARKGVSTSTDARIDVPIERAMNNIEFMKLVDDNGDEWAKKYASSVLFVDYEQCRANETKCRKEMFDFLEVDLTAVATDAQDVIQKFAGSNDPLTGIRNHKETREALGANGFGKHVGLADYTPLQLLVYETDSLDHSPLARGYVTRSNEMRGINVTIIGQGTSFTGFGAKWLAAEPGTLCGLILRQHSSCLYTPLTATSSSFSVQQHSKICPQIV